MREGDLYCMTTASTDTAAMGSTGNSILVPWGWGGRRGWSFVELFEISEKVLFGEEKQVLMKIAEK